ncbi:enhancer of mRNA-decapping protein 3 [Geosmithia morbida]|uniref:Enhancer of mRNA-decapping protein 3 n=1 Tax=Geosmithia morbida TaxID=1094350 RepID=A0A9P4YWN7_9HYPO|nr:enhancer of mRNA-decapping protein 3 [Geosmithia morbida]KAF4123144.1 enhancer of mRNA-decapping protein 3 [Geosmithia morbida]
MAAQFIGLHMRVVLRDPAGYHVHGTVRDVEAGSGLTLTNVFMPGTKNWVPELRIDAANIADLSEIKPELPKPTIYQSPVPDAVPDAVPVAAAPPLPPPQPFVDPAILSLGKPPAPVAVSQTAELQAASPSQFAVQTSSSPMTPVADVAASMGSVRVADAAGNESGGTVTGKGQKKKGRRQNKQTKQQLAGQESDAAPPPGGGGGGGGGGSVGRGKGWRQTPMLQSTASFQPFSSLKKGARGRKAAGDNGLESAEVTEEMGDFDFENNLAKFDKRTIFDQMRREDEVDDASRLVAHNRRPKPLTNGGKNLHPSENVLDLPAAIAKNADFWNSEADDGLQDAAGMSGREARNSANGVRRPDSKNRMSRRSQSRKASTAMAGGQPLSRVNSSQAFQPGLYLVPSNRRVEAISTLQMLNIENIAANELGFTDDLMAENAGRGIAEVVFSALSEPAIKVRFELANSSGSTAAAQLEGSTTVLLAGNNKSSIRALAAARHLRNRNVEVVVCLVGIERERDLLEDLRRQIDLYRGFGGKVLSKNEFFEHLRRHAASGTRVPISLIIDSMLGLAMSFDELRVGDQASVYELMEWANRNEAFVLAVDMPSGIDATTGKIAVIDGGPLFVKPRYVVSIGAPKRGLLEAVTPPGDDDEPEPLAYAAHEDDWRLFIADMGLGSAVWKKAGTKMRRGIDFDGSWVLRMEYRAQGPIPIEGFERGLS